MFSVLICCYQNDISAHLFEALSSIVAQTVKPHEVVIVCDGPIGSDLKRVIWEFKQACEISKIDAHVVELAKNNGLGYALSVGVEICSCPYIVRMDADDVSVNDRIEKLSYHIEKNPDIDVFGAQIEEFVVKPGDMQKRRVVPTQLNEITRRANFRNPMNHVTVCFKKNSVLECGNYENIIGHEDYWLWLKMIKAKKLLQNVSEVHVYVRTDSAGVRRSGLKYLVNEVKFFTRVLQGNLLPIPVVIIGLCGRSIVRLLPSRVSRMIYVFLLRRA